MPGPLSISRHHAQGSRTITGHLAGTREEWLAARLELLEAEKELTRRGTARRGDELARRRQALPWVRVDREYRFETDEGNASLADSFQGGTDAPTFSRDRPGLRAGP
jgi:predicted dithiol-disulfide oxidoreductase (DUF899 family)